MDWINLVLGGFKLKLRLPQNNRNFVTSGGIVSYKMNSEKLVMKN
jgi:hypothetical protein